jgi:transcriptional regulator with XRE-family HTH domain
MKITEEIKKQIINLKKQGLHINEISERLGISDRSVNKYSKDFPHPNRKSLIGLSDFAKKFSLEKAEILGYLCSEGNDNDFDKRYFIFDNRRDKSYYMRSKKEWINFSNTDKTLQNRFIYLMNFVYDYRLKPYKKGSFYIQRKEVVNDLRKYTSFGSRRWKVPKILFFNKYKNHAFRFIRAYLDGDGTVTNWKRVDVSSVNFNSLPELNRLINKLKIKTRYYIYKTISRISIKDIRKYYEFISFIHPEKKEKLKRIVRGLPHGSK